MLRLCLTAALLTMELLASSVCRGYTTLGESVSEGLEDLPNIIWHKKGDSFTTSPIACQDDGVVLLHDSAKEYKKEIHKQNSYTLERGWNYLNAPATGLDVVETFQNSRSVLFVYIYEKNTPAWAGYSPRVEIKEQMREVRLLDLHAIEPALGFYVYANKKTKVNIVSTQLTQRCAELYESGEYGVLEHSVFAKKRATDTESGIALESKYLTHYRRGKYTDTRVMLLYPKLEHPLANADKRKKYGPVEPRALIEYAKEYEEKSFFVFDYFTKRCYEGMFPSKRVPPYPTLKRVE